MQIFVIIWFVVFFYIIAKGIGQFIENENSPVLTGSATIVDKRRKTHHHHSNGHHHHSHSYHITFETQDGEQIELNSLDSEGFGVSWVFPDLIQKPNDQDSFSHNQRYHFLCLDVEICLLLMALLYLCAARK